MRTKVDPMGIIFVVVWTALFTGAGAVAGYSFAPSLDLERIVQLQTEAYNMATKIAAVKCREIVAETKERKL